MSEYKSCMGGSTGVVDPRTKYVILNGAIQEYKSEGGLMGFGKKWKLIESTAIVNLVIVDKSNKGSGSGVATVDVNGKRQKFYIFGEFENFLSEMILNGAKSEV